MGLEPTISAWKANVLPLHYARKRDKMKGGAQYGYPPAAYGAGEET